MNGKPSTKAWILLIVLSLIWGSSFILIKRGLLGLTPMELGAVRLVSAGLALIPMALKHAKKIPAHKFKYLIAVSLCGSLIPSFLFAYAQTHTPSNVAGALNAVTPLLTFIVGVVFFSEKAHPKVIISILIGLIGSVILIDPFAGERTTFNPYTLLVVMAALLYAFNSNLIKFRLEGIDFKAITSLSLLFGGVIAGGYLLFFTSLLSNIQVKESTRIATAYISVLGILGTAVALLIFNRLVQLTTPVFTSSVTYIIPFIALFWGIMDGESFSWSQILGMVLILGGVYLTNQRSAKQKKPD